MSQTQPTDASADTQENFDDRLTPQVIAGLDAVFAQMQPGRALSDEQIDQRMAEVRETWTKNRSH